MRLTYLVLIAGLTFACGKIDKTEVASGPIPGSENQQGAVLGPALAVADMTQVPPCTAANEGQLVYARTQAVFATCNSGTWVKIDVGSGGATSSSGISNALYCSMQVSKADLLTAGLDTAPNEGIQFFYTVTQFNNKTRYVQASVSSGSFSNSTGIFWNDKQVGYGKAKSDGITFDVLGAKDFGYFYMTADTEITEDEKNPYGVVYVDPASQSGILLKFDAQKECRSQVY
ncbi:MAG: hypothetical protein H7318_04095 [Oligoflexus sp.]|nr:hypothetical protein [Oligoflexus sp.]